LIGIATFVGNSGVVTISVEQAAVSLLGGTLQFHPKEPHIHPLIVEIL